jgi:hypothetical protein
MAIALISTLIPRDTVDIAMLQCILKLSNASIFSQYQHHRQILNGEDGGEPPSYENEGGASNNTSDFRFDGHS